MPVQNKNNALYWATGIDNSGLKQDADETKSIINGMSGDIEKTSESVTDAIDKIGQTAIESAKQQITNQKAIIKQIEDDIKNLESQTAKAAPGNAKSDLQSEINSAKKALQEEKAILAGIEQQVEGVSQKHQTLRSRIREAREELAQMEMAGQRGSDEYNKLRITLGELVDQMGDTTAQATVLANDERGFAAVAQTVSGMAGAMSAATGVVSLFGDKNEDLQKVEARLQAVMAITIGLQQVAQTLNKDSYFSVIILTRSKEILAATELKLATAIGVSTAAARAFMIATGAIAVVGLVAFISAIMKVADAHEKQRDAAIDAAKKEQESFSEIAKGYATEQSKIQGLESAIHSENVSRDNKLKMIQQLKDMIPGYTAELSKEGDVIRENKKAIDDYMSSLEKSLKLKAAEKELEAIYTKMYGLQKLVDGAGSGNTGLGKDLAKQGQTEIDKSVQATKSGIAKGAQEGITELQKQADTIKEFISKNGLVSDEVLKKQEDKTVKSAVERYNAEKNLQALLLDINQKTASVLLDQQADSLKKRLDLVEQEKNQELQAIQEKEVAIIEAYNKSQKQQVEEYNKTHTNKKTFTALSTKPEDIQNSLSTINPDQAAKLQTATVGVVAAYGQKAKEETQKWNEELLSLAREFADKRVQIAYDYNEKIKKLQSEGLIDAANEAMAQRDKAVSDETSSMIQNTELFKTLTDEKINISKKATETLLEQIREQLLNELNAGKLSVEQLNQLMDQVNDAQSRISSNKNQNNPFAQLGAAISNKSAASSAYSKALADPSTSAADLAKLESASNAATASMAQAAGASLQGVQSILGSVVGGLDELGMLTEDQKKTANEVIGMVGGAANLAMGIASGNPMQIIQGSVDLLVNGFKLFDSKSRAAEKDIKKQQELIDSLKKSYDDLETAVSKSFSTAKANLVTQEMENLKQQNEAIAKQMQDERDKKKTDENAVKEYQNTIDENNKKIAELKDSYLEALTGTDVMSAIDSFAQAYSDAWTSGENAAKKSTDLVKDLLKKSLVEYLKNQIQPEVKSLMEAIGNAMTDGIISDAELAQIEAEKQMIDAQAASQQKQFDKLGLGSSSSGVTGELQSAMTEGTGSQLVGLWNMTAMDIRWIREWLAIKSGVSPVEGSTDVVKVLQDTLTETKRISDNTKKSADNSDLILSELRDLNNKPNNNNNNGSRRSAL